MMQAAAEREQGRQATAAANGNNNALTEQGTTAAAGGGAGATSRGPPSVFILETPPRRLPIIFLSEPWSHALFSQCDGWWCNFFLCFRHHFLGQFEVMKREPTQQEIDEAEALNRPDPRMAGAGGAGGSFYENPPWLFPMMLCCDILTAGMPCGIGWPGCCSAVYGCQVRTSIRKRYHIVGSGMDDLMLSSCCPSFVARQHHRELLNHSIVYSGIPQVGSSDRMI